MLLRKDSFINNSQIKLPSDSSRFSFVRTGLLTLGSLVIFAGQSFASDNNEQAGNDSQVVNRATSEYFQSRLPLLNGVPDLNEFSQCRAPTQLGDWQDLESAIWQTQSSDLQQHRKRQLLADSVPENSAKLTLLQGNVQIRDHQTLMRADQITLDHQSQGMTASGQVSFESAEAFFRANSLTQNQSDSPLVMQDTQFLLFGNNANGQAKQISIAGDESIALTQLAFSTCPLGDKSWQLTTDDMQIDGKGGVGEAWSTVLRVNDVPILYLPYIRFPVDDRRTSGLLFPSFKNSNKNGLDFAQPIYWNIAPNMDATLTPRYVEKRGQQLGLEYRLLTAKTESQVEVQWMEKDRLIASQLADPQDGIVIDATSAERWLGRIQHTSQFTSHWRSHINASQVSDSDYFRDFGDGLESGNETRLKSELSVFYEDEIWQMQWFALSHQSLIGTDSYRYLPSFTTQADYLSEQGVRWQFNSEVTRFEHKDPTRLDGSRADVLPSVSYPIKSSWGFLTPKLGYQVSQFEQESPLNAETQSISRRLPIFSLDSGIYLDRDFSWQDKDYLHSLSPRLFYAYIPFEDQEAINIFDTGINELSFNQLWREDRFSGADRVGDTNRLSLALGNAVINRDSGQELINLQIGRSFYFDDRKVQLDNSAPQTQEESPWLAQLDWQLSDSWSFKGAIEWNSDDNTSQRSETRIKFEPKTNHIVNLSHRYRDLAGEQFEELDFSLALPLNDRWRMVARWYNDLNQSQTIEALAGIEYQSCCWGLRLVAQRYLNTQLDSLGQPIFVEDEYNEGIYFQFVFKGLGSAGDSGLDKMLTKSIRGYRDAFRIAPKS